MGKMRQVTGHERLLWLTVLPVLAMLAVIYLFSAQNAEVSTLLSDRVLGFLLSLLPKKSAAELMPEVEFSFSTSRLIRKLAHFTEFAALGFFMLGHGAAMRRESGKLRTVMLWSWLACVLCAAGDEFHQHFVSGRAPLAMDVMIDSAGAAAGIAAMALLIFIIRRWQGRNLQQ